MAAHAGINSTSIAASQHIGLGILVAGLLGKHDTQLYQGTVQVVSRCQIITKDLCAVLGRHQCLKTENRKLKTENSLHQWVHDNDTGFTTAHNRVGSLCSYSACRNSGMSHAVVRSQWVSGWSETHMVVALCNCNRQHLHTTHLQTCVQTIWSRSHPQR